METTIKVPAKHLPLPYVPELPADFVRMLQECRGQTAN
jgi:hypothetical protein